MFYFIGDAGFDHYKNLNQDFLGGCSLNAATHFKRNSKADATLIYPTNHDNHLIEQHCQREGIRTIPITRDGTMPRQLINIRKDGEKDFIEYNAGVLESVILSKQEEDLIRSIKGTIISPLYTQVLPFINQILEINQQAEYVFDFHDASDFNFDPRKMEKYLSHARLVQFGLSQEHGQLTNFLGQYAKDHNTEIIITRGGAQIDYLQGHKSESFNPTYIDSIVDSTGAGDAFLGSFLALGNIKEASQYASNILMRTGSL